MLKKKIKVIFMIIAVFIIGISIMDINFENKASAESEVMFLNESITLKDINKINKVLKELKGSNYYKDINISEDHTEKILSIFYSINNALGESDYINFWNDINKREIIISNAVYMFLIIDELDKVIINLEDSIGEEFVINRSDIENVYNIALEEYEINEENLAKLMTKDCIEEIWYIVNG